MLAVDVEHAARIAFDAWNGSISDWSARFHRDIENIRHYPVVALDSQNSIVGYARTCWHEDDLGEENSAPNGWYLMGLRVEEAARGRGIGQQLTSARLNWLAERAEKAYCLISSHNVPSRELHEQLGFTSHGSDFNFPGLEIGHEELLFSIELPQTP